MTESGYVWRPSMFAPAVVHLTRDGDIAYTSDRYPGEQYVHAACGQDTDPGRVESLDSMRCPECVAWLKQTSGPSG